MGRFVCEQTTVFDCRNQFYGLFVLLLLSQTVYAQTLQDWVRQADKEQDPVKAEQFYTEALRINPNAEDALLGRAIVRGRLNRLQEGIEDISAAIGLTNKQPSYYGQRAYLLVQLSEYDAASSDYQQAIDLSPRDARYYSGLSYCRLKQNRLAEALSLSQKGIDLEPASPYSYRNRGRARLYSGKVDTAIEDFQRSLDRQHAEPYRVLTDFGEAYERKKEYARSADYYRQALAIKPGYSDAEIRLLGLTRNGLLNEKKVGSASSRPVLTGTGASTFTGRRVALVIGNSEYLTIEPHLQDQPIEDAKAIYSRLRDLGFTATIDTNTDAETLREGLNKFYEAASGADLVFFYFAGHGLQYNGSNYLLPTDIELYVSNPDSYVAKLNSQALLVTTVIERLQKCNPRFCLIVLDACREDPLRKTQTLQPNGNRPNDHLTPSPFVPIVVENFIRNCCVAQATAAGSRAWNGPGRNGCYTEALLRYLNRGSSLEKTLKQVRNDVLETSKKAGAEQRPEFLDQTTDDLIF